MTHTKAKVVDTSTLIHDPFCLSYLTQAGAVACIPWTVLEELDGLKTRPDIGFDAREATRIIESLRSENHPHISIVRDTDWEGMEHIDRVLNDHIILAASRFLQKKFDDVTVVSKDAMMRIKAREMGIRAEDYYQDQAHDVDSSDLPIVKIPADEIDFYNFTFPYHPDVHGEVPMNGGVIGYSDWSGDFKRPMERVAFGEQFAAIRRGEHFDIVPGNIQAFGIRPYNASFGGDADAPPNWAQSLALYCLMCSDISLVFLEGGAGTGKTLLALASALATRSEYRQILVTRPMVHLEDRDNMGYLPGDIREKMAPWLRPIWQNLSVLKDLNHENKEQIEKFIVDKKIDIEPLDYIRGTTFIKSYLIIDEAQNLTPHQVKTIITRAGMGTKLVFTGDLEQIDRKRRLDKSSNGLAYAASRMAGRDIVANVKFFTSVRSELAKMGVDLL